MRKQTDHSHSGLIVNGDRTCEENVLTFLPQVMRQRVTVRGFKNLLEKFFLKNSFHVQIFADLSLDGVCILV